MKNKFVAIVLCLVLALDVLPGYAFAESDTTAPTLVSISVDKDIYNIGETITITAEITDESDVTWADFLFYNSSEVSRGFVLKHKNGNTYEGQLTVGNDWTEDTYSLRAYFLKDYYGNENSTYKPQVPDVSFEISSYSGDSNNDDTGTQTALEKISVHVNESFRIELKMNTSADLSVVGGSVNLATISQSSSSVSIGGYGTFIYGFEFRYSVPGVYSLVLQDSATGKQYAYDVTVSDHSWDTEHVSWTWTDDYTAQAAFTCTDCDTTTTIAASVSSSRIEPTCDNGGSLVYKAVASFKETEYSDSKTVALAALGHAWGEWTVTTPATCTEVGEETRVCINDSSHTEEKEVPATGHTWGEWTVTTPATCTEAGEETRVCINDSSHTEAKEVPATGHAWGEWTVTTPATCTEVGEETRVCINDSSHTETRTTAVVAHTPGNAVKENEIAATCTEAGSYDNVVYCTVCGAELSRETITTTGHNYEPTWTWTDNYKSANLTLTCAQCGDSHEIQATVTGEEHTDKIDYTATAVYDEVTYQQTQTAGRFALNLSWDGVFKEYDLTRPLEAATMIIAAYDDSGRFVSCLIPDADGALQSITFTAETAKIKVFFVVPSTFAPVWDVQELD